MTKGLNVQVQDFCRRPLMGHYPVIWTDALYEKVHVDDYIVSLAVLAACGVNVDHGTNDGRSHGSAIVYTYYQMELTNMAEQESTPL